MLALIQPFISGIGAKLLAFGAAALTVLLILARAKSAGRAAERIDGMKRVLKTVETRHEVEREVRRIDGDAALERLRDKWSRD